MNYDEMLRRAHGKAKQDNPEVYAQIVKAMEDLCSTEKLDSVAKWDTVSIPNLKR